MESTVLHKDNIQDVYGLTPMQEGIYFHALSDEASQSYFSQVSYRIIGSIQPELVEQSLDLLVKRHDILRTVFSHKKTNEVIQIVLKQQLSCFSYEDIRLQKDISQYVASLIEADRNKPFNLNRDVLMRVTLLRIGDEAFEFIWSHHHILMDGWCTGVLIKEFTEIYQSLVQQRTPRLQPVQPFRNFIEWLQRQDHEAARTFWKKYLHGFEEVTSLPSYTRHTGPDYINQEITVAAGVQLSNRLRRVCSDARITVNNLLHTAWSVLLWRYTAQDDIVFGCVKSVRPAEVKGIENMIGLFINTVPVRIKLQHDEKFIELAASVQERALICEAHDFFPLASIQSLSDVKQHLIQHVFITENFPVQQQLAGLNDQGQQTNLRAEFDSNFSQTNYQFNIIAEPGEDIVIKLNYNAHVYNQRFIEQVGRHYMYLLEQISNTPQVLIGNLGLLQKHEELQLLRCGTGPLLNNSETIISLFQKIVRHRSEHIAVKDKHEQLSYHQLNERSDEIARKLLSKGIKAGDVVAVRCGNSIATVITLLATWKLNAVYLPLDVQLPAERLEFIVQDAGASLVVDQAFIDEQFFHGSVVLPSYTNQPDAIAYIIYTSGSTGQPKGVPIKHKSIASRILYHNQHLGNDNDDVILQFASVAFDASLVEMLMSLLCGGTLFVADAGSKQDTTAFLNIIDTQNITLAILPPAYLKILSPHPLPSLRKLISTGEAAIVDDMVFYAATKDVYNGYGPSEVCIGASFHKVDAARDHEYRHNRAIPIGRPFEDTVIYVVDKQHRLMPDGVVGEIAVSGVGLSPGYLKQEELTKTKFVANPYALQTGHAIMYRTGDAGRWNSNGELEYTGRTDKQVQLRGIRVEPEEIEHVIRLGQNVSDARVLVSDVDGQRMLVAFVIMNGKSAFDIRAYLKERLPAYMVPGRIIQLEKFPLNSSGKTDLRQLQILAEDQHAEDVIDASGTVEEVLLAAITAVMGKGLHMGSDFFEAGGDSIKAIQISSRLQKNGYNISIKDIFSNPRLRDMAGCIKIVTRVPEQGLIEGNVPLTPVQHEFFDIQLQHPHHFNQSIGLRSQHKFDTDVLRQVFYFLCRHHDALRMTFTTGASGIQQYNMPQTAANIFSVVDLAAHDDAAAQMMTHMQQLQRSFELDKGPLFKAVLYRLQQEDRLLMVAHHLLVDGVSWRILLEDFNQLYDQSIHSMELFLPAKTDSFKYWSETLQQFAASESIEPHLSFWRKLAADASCVKPFSVDASIKQEYNECYFTLNEQDTDLLLKKTSNAFGTEPQEIIIAALAKAFAESMGRLQLYMMMEGHGRQSLPFADVNISRTVGWFTSLYPLLVTNEEESNDASFIKNTKEAIRAIPEKGIGYGICKYLLRDEQVRTVSPSILFNYLGQFDQDVSNSKFSVWADNLGDAQDPANAALFQLMISAFVFEGKLHCKMRYNAAAFETPAMQQFCNATNRHLVQLTHFAAARPYREVTPCDLGFKELPARVLEQMNNKYSRLCESMIQDVYRLTPTQEGMLYHWLMQPHSHSYSYQVVYKIKGRLSVEAVEFAINQLVNRHASLRTVFDHTSYTFPLQVVLFSRPVQINYTELPVSDTTSVQEWIDSKGTPFNLTSDKLLRISIARFNDDEYLLKWSSHHIILDGWSMGVVMSEFSRFYTDFIDGNATHLAKPFSYRDYVSWIYQQHTETSLDYWERTLADYENAASLPSMHATDAGDETIIGHHNMTVSGERFNKLKKMAAQSQITMNVLVQTLWGILLARYNDVNDVVFGSVVAGRPASLQGADSLVGLCINTIPVRVRFDESSSFAGLCKTMMKWFNESEPHHSCPLSAIQEKTSQRSGLFNNVIDFINYPAAFTKDDRAKQSQPLSISAYGVQEQTNYDLIIVASAGIELQLSFKYNTAKLHELDIADATAKLELLIDQVITNKWISLNKLRITTDAEDQLLLAQSTGASKPYPLAHAYATVFSQRMHQHYGSTAVTDRNKSWTYAVLNAHSDNLACFINDAGVKKGQVVAVHMDRCVEMVSAIIAIWKCGGVYLPVEPGTPAERTRYMLNDAGAVLLLTNTENVAGAAGVHQLVLDRIPASNRNRAQQDFDAGDLAYILYTSGSTGMPKGVMIEHAGMLNHLFEKIDNLNICTGDKIAQIASQSFDVSIWQMFAPLLAGAQLRIFNKDELLATDNFLKDIDTEQVNIAQAVPTFLSEILRSLETTCSSLSFSALRYFLVSGEELHYHQAERWMSRMLNVKLVNSYGPTEASDIVSFSVIDSLPADRIITIGKPVPNMRVYIVSNEQQLCPCGVTGEIWISGVGVGRGYVNLPDKTAQAFIPDPFVKGERVYRTGDIGRWNARGEIEFLGRRDAQVKIRGHRIETGEIEAALLKHNNVKQASVIFEKDAHSPLLIAFVVLHRQAPVADLRQWLTERLPLFMIPGEFVLIDQIPVTSSAKTDRRKLLLLRNGQLHEGVQEETLTANESLLMNVWKDVLRRNGFSKNDDFLAIGGNSIQAIQISARCHQLNYKVEVKDIFLHRNIASLAAAMQPLDSLPQVELNATESVEEAAITTEDLELIKNMFTK